MNAALKRANEAKLKAAFIRRVATKRNSVNSALRRERGKTTKRSETARRSLPRVIATCKNVTRNSTRRLISSRRVINDEF